MRLPSFNRADFRTKLTVLVIMGTAIALVLVAAAVVAFDYVGLGEDVRREVGARAEITANVSRAVVDFDDPVGAKAILEALDGDENLVAAATYKDEALLAQFARGDGDITVPARPRAPGAYRDGQRLSVYEPVVSNGEVVGTIYLSYDMSWIVVHLLRKAGIVSAAVALSFIVSIVLTRRLQRTVVRPVRHLSETARRVSSERDYSLRAKKFSEDELGDLTESFNEMLSEIQARDAALRGHREQLETKIHARTEDLEIARAEAEQANEAKSAFLANMSHEIRTPMSAILGYAEILYAEGDLSRAPKRRLDALETIRRNGQHLLNIINNILDLSKLEVDKMTVEHVSCSPVQIVNDVLKLMRVRSEAKGLILEQSAELPVPRTILSDPTRLRQILVNLTGNAIKFTKRGSVRIRIDSVERSGPDGPRLSFRVSDTGIGLDDGQLRELFEPFTQADTTTTRRFGGTGLGLAISQRFAGLLGGEITASGAPGEGCTFTLTVATGSLEGIEMLKTQAQVDAERLASPDVVVAYSSQLPSALAGLRVLVAEDAPDNQRLIRYHLERGRANVEIVDDGQEAVERALEAEREGRPFDVLLMDMQMPRMDGYTASTRLRAAGYGGPIIALTAHAMQGDRDRCLEAGMSDYVTKPIEPPMLFAAIRRATGRDGSPDPGRPSAAPVASSLVDVESALARAGGSPEFLAELIDCFLESSETQLAELRGAVGAGDADRVARAAHALRGSVSNFGAAEAAEAAQRLETLAGDGEAGALVSALVEFEAAFATLKPALLTLREEMAT